MLPKHTINSSHGSSVVIYEHGSHVTSWKSNHGEVSKQRGGVLGSCEDPRPAKHVVSFLSFLCRCCAGATVHELPGQVRTSHRHQVAGGPPVQLEEPILITPGFWELLLRLPAAPDGPLCCGCWLQGRHSCVLAPVWGHGQREGAARLCQEHGVGGGTAERRQHHDGAAAY